MEEKEITDEAVISLVKGGDKKAFEIIVDRYIEKIKRYGRKFLSNRDDVDDLVQEVFLKVYVNLNSFDENRKFSPWIYRIAHNEFVNAIKKKVYEKIFNVDFDLFFPHPEAKENLEKEGDQHFRANILDQHLAKIDSKYREVIVLYYFEDMGYKEISEVLRIPTSTVGVRLRRGKKALKKLIGDKEL